MRIRPDNRLRSTPAGDAPSQSSTANSIRVASMEIETSRKSSITPDRGQMHLWIDSLAEKITFGQSTACVPWSRTHAASRGVQIIGIRSGARGSSRSASNPILEYVSDDPTTAPTNPVQWVMLPTMPSGQTGARCALTGISRFPSPNRSRARRAHHRPSANSRWRDGTARDTARASSGMSGGGSWLPSVVITLKCGGNSAVDHSGFSVRVMNRSLSPVANRTALPSENKPARRRGTDGASPR